MIYWCWRSDRNRRGDGWGLMSAAMARSKCDSSKETSTGSIYGSTGNCQGRNRGTP